jgi:hypothetical protein
LSVSRRNHAEPLSLWAWSKMVRRVALEAGVPRFSTHTTRHLCLTDLARMGTRSRHRSAEPPGSWTSGATGIRCTPRHRLRGMFSQALLINGSPLLEDLATEAFAALRAHPASIGRYRETIHALQRAYAGLGYCDPPVRTGFNHASGIDCTAPQWAACGERWHATSALTPRGPRHRAHDHGQGQAAAGRRAPPDHRAGTIIPALCAKAGVPTADVRGNIISHRAQSTIASQLYNAKEPMTLFELQAWLGHKDPGSTQHYAKITPNTLARAYAEAGYFARNVPTIEVLLDGTPSPAEPPPAARVRRVGRSARSKPTDLAPGDGYRAAVHSVVTSRLAPRRLRSGSDRCVASPRRSAATRAQAFDRRAAG